MRAFTVLTAPAVAIDRPNIDTDLLIPKQHLISIGRAGYGRHLFDDLRHLEDGSDNPDFILNQSRAKGAAILLARGNFGCGSSREHAVWALDEFGFRAVIAPSFGDIFRNNSLGVGLLLVDLPEDRLAPLMAAVLADQGAEVTVDLRSQLISGPGGLGIAFDFDPVRKERHLGGLDAIDLTLKKAPAIEAYEKAHAEPWRAALPGSG